jgi:hypothetical protein
MAIAAQDTAGLARWYVDTLGFQVVIDGGPKGIWFVGPPAGEALVEEEPGGVIETPPDLRAAVEEAAAAVPEDEEEEDR